MKKLTGFTLIELLIAIAIVAILTAIAIPAYNNYILQARRADGQTTLLDLANRMEQYFTQNNTYVGATPANVGVNVASPQGFYTISIGNLGASTYTLTAAPAGSQVNDTSCGNLTLDQLGQKGRSGTATDCWGN